MLLGQLVQAFQMACYSLLRPLDLSQSVRSHGRTGDKVPPLAQQEPAGLSEHNALRHKHHSTPCQVNREWRQLAWRESEFCFLD